MKFGVVVKFLGRFCLEASFMSEKDAIEYKASKDKIEDPENVMIIEL